MGIGDAARTRSGERGRIWLVVQGGAVVAGAALEPGLPWVRCLPMRGRPRRRITAGTGEPDRRNVLVACDKRYP